jgi:DnaJ-class molecular chaperone
MAGVLELDFRDAALGARRSIRSGSGASIEVNIPPGVESGNRLRVPGAGGAAPRGGAPGDLHLDIAIKPDPYLRRNGGDVEVDLPLSIGEAVLGTKVDVPTVEGAARVTIPPGTSSGSKLRLRGKGIKRPDGARGDQLCNIQVVVPKLKPEDAESRHLVEELERRTRSAPVRRF